MFEFGWAQKKIWCQYPNVVQAKGTRIDAKDIERIELLHWCEHCLECAPPECYRSCPLYRPRSDKKCARFSYGIYPNRAFKGLLNCGADIQFRRWAKLETQLFGTSVSIRWHRLFHSLDRCIYSVVNILSSVLILISPYRRLNGVLTYLRNKLFKKLSRLGTNTTYDAFIMECFSPQPRPFRLLLEHTDEIVGFRHAFEIFEGLNYYEVPVNNFHFSFYPLRGKLTLYPENDAEVRLIFTWLDFVKFKADRRGRKSILRETRSSEKLKCVAWDLDNTIWEGILIEDGEENLRLRPEAVKLVKILDEKGIIQTVVSKNDYAQAWSIIEKFNLHDYFIYPAINWAPKSSNIKQIASKLNINVDSLALIDDSEFERAEVQSSLPQVRVYAETQIPELLDYREFDLPVTDLSKKRRLSYIAQIQREKAREEFPEDYEKFLMSCQMQMHIFVPREEDQISRCLELIQRSNQLNLSSRRYGSDEFRQLLGSEDIFCLSIQCRDRFGDYGIIGFASVDERQEEPQILDFVISCRVAQKRVEHAFFEWLARKEASKGRKVLRVTFNQTERNGPLLRVFEEMPFEVSEKVGNQIHMELTLHRNIVSNPVIAVTEDLGI